MRIFASLAALALVAAATPAVAQISQIEAKAGAAWEHKNSGITLPPAMFGIARDQIRQIGANELDVIASYVQGSEVISLYIYRHVSGAVPLWLDRARLSIEMRPDAYGKLTPLGAARPFTPPGQPTASGLIMTYGATKGLTTTSVAMAAIDGWLIKLRYSSATLTPQEVDARIAQAFAALRWPAKIAAQPAAMPIAACGDTLAFTGASKDVPEDLSASMANAMLSNIVDKKVSSGEAKVSAPIVWCRDSTTARIGTVYRPDNNRERYLLAISDAGRALIVGPNVGAAMLDKSKKAPPSFNVQYVDLATTSIFGAQDRLPTPDRAIEIVEKSAPKTTVGTWGKERAINVTMPK